MKSPLSERDIRTMEYGQGLVEYALILVGVVFAVILALTLTGETLKSTYCRVAEGLGGGGCGCVFGFDDADSLEQWSGNNEDDYFAIENGQACMTGNGKARIFLNNCPTAYSSNDIVITATYMTFSSAGNGNAGVDILFRALDDENHYKFIYNASGDYVRFWKVVYGKWIQLGSAKVPKAWKNEVLNFRIEVRGDNFKAYRDDQFLLEVNDAMFTEGQVGLRNKPGSKTCLDELSVAPLP
jgi:hypothetical protein